MTKILDFCDTHDGTDYASLIFKQVLAPNIFLYNAMIRVYSNNRFFSEAISVYKQMLADSQNGRPILPDRFTFPFALKSSAGLLHLHLGNQIHGHICKLGLAKHSYVQNALLDMYAKCGSLDAAQQAFVEMSYRDTVSWNTLLSGYAGTGNMSKAKEVFATMPERTIISWTAMVSGYARSNYYREALQVFHQMQLAELRPDETSIVSVLPACAQSGALELGKWIHVYADRHNFLRNICICNALIEMYVKCGSIEEARELFVKMPERDVISWSTIINGFAHHSQSQVAIQLFHEMKVAGVEPNSITFLGVLSACVHGGLLYDGLQYFESMMKDHHINPKVEHYGCLVDLLGRNGQLDSALEFIQDMPIEPDAAIWGSLLSACKIHGNVRIAITAMEHLVQLEPEDMGNYVLLSNIYAAERQWDDVSRIRKLMRSRKTNRSPGCSLIEVNNLVQEFVAGEGSYPQAEEIYNTLHLLDQELRIAADIVT
ncbi:Pentatricopeptide repeat-containing protein [Nymphaea thermarum]|nr:Pentatricopeptide repeat-containing protein [Nymphaea thermarum]